MVSIIGVGNRSTRRKHPTCRKSLANVIEYQQGDKNTCIEILNYKYIFFSVKIMMFKTSFNNIISWRSVLSLGKTKYPVKTTDLSQIYDELYHIMFILLSSLIYSLS